MSANRYPYGQLPSAARLRSSPRLSPQNLPKTPSQKEELVSKIKDNFHEQFMESKYSKAYLIILIIVTIILIIAYIYFLVMIWNSNTTYIASLVSFTLLIIILIIHIVKMFRYGSNGRDAGFLVILIVVFLACIIGSYYLTKHGHSGWGWVIALLPVILYIIAIIIILLVFIAMVTGKIFLGTRMAERLLDNDLF